MDDRDTGLNLVLGIGFKVGFLVVLVGLGLFFLPIFNAVVGDILAYADLWGMYDALPPNAQVIMVGLTLVGCALVVAAFRELVKMLVSGLFHKDGADF